MNLKSLFDVSKSFQPSVKLVSSQFLKVGLGILLLRDIKIKLKLI